MTEVTKIFEEIGLEMDFAVFEASNTKIVYEAGVDKNQSGSYRRGCSSNMLNRDV